MQQRREVWTVPYVCISLSADRLDDRAVWADEAEGKKRTGNSLTSSHATASTSNAREAASRAAQARAAPPPPASSPAKRPPSSPARGVIGRSNGPAIDIDGEVTEDEDDPVTAAEADGMLNDAEVLDEIAEVEEPARKKAKFSFGGGSSPAKGEEEDPFAAPATPASSQGKRSAAGSQSQWCVPPSSIDSLISNVAHRDRIRNDPASPFHARNEALKNAMSSPSSSQQSDTTMTPTALATDDALRQLDTLDSAFGGASPALAAIRKAITTEQRRAMAATKQKDTVVAIKDKEIAALKAEVAWVCAPSLRRSD